MESGARGASGRHVLNLVVQKHVQGHERANPTPVDSIVRETVLKNKPANILPVEVSASRVL